MTNEAARAYAVVALSQLQDKIRKNDIALARALLLRMVELMDVYTEAEIDTKARKVLRLENQ